MRKVIIWNGIYRYCALCRLLIPTQVFAQEGHGKIDFASFCFADNEGVKEAFAVGGGIVRRFAHALCNIHGGRGTI